VSTATLGYVVVVLGSGSLVVVSFGLLSLVPHSTGGG